MQVQPTEMSGPAHRGRRSERTQSSDDSDSNREKEEVVHEPFISDCDEHFKTLCPGWTANSGVDVDLFFKRSKRSTLNVEFRTDAISKERRKAGIHDGINGSTKLFPEFLLSLTVFQSAMSTPARRKGSKN
jgi:hypothetical protein